MSEDTPQFPSPEGKQPEQQSATPEVPEVAGELGSTAVDESTETPPAAEPEATSTNEIENSPEQRAEKLATEIAKSSAEGRELRWKALQAAQKNHNFSP